MKKDFSIEDTIAQVLGDVSPEEIANLEEPYKSYFTLMLAAASKDEDDKIPNFVLISLLMRLVMDVSELKAKGSQKIHLL